MGNKVLGIDMGTNSIGWAVVEKDNNEFTLLDKGVRIFQEGVKIEKGNEFSKAAERTSYRAARRLKYRRKLRKIEVLKTLSEAGYCPKLTTEELNQWRYKKIYPQNKAFKHWWMTDNQAEENERKKQEKNPYRFRNTAATQKLDLSSEYNRHLLGRAFYHLAQRRGFLSNRLDSNKESNGVVQTAIDNLQKEKGERTLGQLFYQKYTKGEKIRAQYTHRETDYLHEFKQICTLQELPTDFVNSLQKAIFTQRPLRSQKSMVGKCVFEVKKPRCAVSRPEYEEYRMLCFINNIKIKTPADQQLRFLNDQEKLKIKPLFFRKSKPHFNFEDIAAKLAPKKQFKHYKSRDKNPEDWLFNYSMNTNVSACPLSAYFKDIFGQAFIDEGHNYVKDEAGQSPKTIEDAWHVLFTFDSDKKLKGFAETKLGLNEDETKKFLGISLKQDYASLSLKAINKILPYLREGLIYSHAVFMANMPNILPEAVWQDKAEQERIKLDVINIIQGHSNEIKIEEAINGLIKTSHENQEYWSEEAGHIYQEELLNKLKSQFGAHKYAEIAEPERQRMEKHAIGLFKAQMGKNMGKGEFVKPQRIDDKVRNYLADSYLVTDKNLEKLYHPSAQEVYKPPLKNESGVLILNSPMVSSVRNPMAMRALHQLRKVVNSLIIEGLVDARTKVNIELSRGLLNANERAGLKRWQNEREKQKKEYAKKIKEHYLEKGLSLEPTDNDILKYQLWEEQKHKCLYTGKEIGISEFLGGNPMYDIEHTVPRSVSLDNSQVNKTLCESDFNRNKKMNKLPSELSAHEEILLRVKHWEEKYEALDNQIKHAVRKAKTATTKESKDSAIQTRHKLSFEKDYYYKKHKLFTITEVPENFKNSQLVDTGIITKYSRMYLNTYFNKVYTVKGATVADFRRIWGLQEEYGKKERVNHVHHCLDAITMACVTKQSYERLAKFYHDWEDVHRAETKDKPQVKKPWATFTQDVKNIENELLVSHYTASNLPKPSKKKKRKGGRVEKDGQGNVIYQQGDSVRGALHNETFYGAIERDGVNKKGETERQIKYVVRKSLKDIRKTDVEKIVDQAVKEKVKKAIDDGVLTLSSSDTSENKFSGTVWMNLDKNVAIKKVRVFQDNVKNPIHLKKQRDRSRNEYKQSILVTNASNYSLVFFEGQKNNGKPKRDFQVITSLEAGKYFKASVQKEISPKKERFEGLIKETGLPVRAMLKAGQNVLFYKNHPEEIWELDNSEKAKRLYKIIGFEGDGRIQFRYHQVAMQQSSMNKDEMTIKKYMDENKLKNSEVNFEDPVPWLRLTKGAWNMLIENVDFKIDALGRVQPQKQNHD